AGRLARALLGNPVGIRGFFAAAARPAAALGLGVAAARFLGGGFAGVGRVAVPRLWRGRGGVAGHLLRGLSGGGLGLARSCPGGPFLLGGIRGIDGGGFRIVLAHAWVPAGSARRPAW